MEPSFYQTENGVLLSLCGGAAGLEKLEPGVSDGAAEKHVPAVETDGSRVRVSVGSVLHPMDLFADLLRRAAALFGAGAGAGGGICAVTGGKTGGGICLL